MKIAPTVIATLLVVAVSSGCSGSSESSAPTTTAAPTTTRPIVWTGTVTRETDVDGNYRQGIARSGDGWIFTTNNAIYRTDASFTEVESHKEAIPADLAAQGYNHLGDPDVADGLIWIPVERDDKDHALQVTARYDEDSLAFVDAVEVTQHHNAFVAVDDDGVAYSTDQFGDDTLLRYTVADGAAVAEEPLVMSQFVDRIQGGDVLDGAIFLSTDDDHNGVYRVDLATGEVTDLGSAGHVDGEGEGIDATDLPVGQLHVLVADEAIAPMWVIDVEVSPRG